ncbi:MAG: ribonuclease H-like domain-containing protein [Treponema sp.]|nr:ribonuclease H-like domain-containing protein [Treponema sp.]
MHGRGLKIFRNYRSLAREFYSGKIFAAFDTETTGLHAATDHLMEIGAVKFNRDGIIGEPFSSLIKPPVPLTPFLQNLTHITPEMLENQSDASTVTFEFLRWLSSDDVILIAHNAPFDMYFINAQLERMNMDALKNTVIDTLPLSRWAYPNLNKNGLEGQYKLQNLASLLNIKVLEAHRAHDDARVCMELFKRIIKDTRPVQKDIEKQTQESLFSQENGQLELF